MTGDPELGRTGFPVDALATSPVPPAPTTMRRGTVDAVASAALTLVVGLLSALVISRLYGVVVVGEFALVAAPYALVGLFSNLGEHQAIVRVLSADEPGSERSRCALVVQLGFSTLLTLLVGAVVAGAAVLLLRATGHPGLVGPALLLVLGYVALGNPGWNSDVFHVAFRRTRTLAVLRFLDLALLLVLSVALGLVRAPTVGSLVLAQLLTTAATTALRLVLLHRLVSGRTTRAGLAAAVHEQRAFVRFGIRLVPGSAASTVTAQAATWIIGAARPLAVLGAYSRANNLANRLLEIGWRLGEVLLPALSTAASAGDVAEAQRRFTRWRLPVLLVLAGTCAALAGSARGLLGVFGPGFDAAALPLALLVPAYAAGVVAFLHQQFLVALGRPVPVSRLVLLRCAVTVAALLPLTLRFGATGAAASMLAGYALELLLSVRAVERAVAAHGVEPEPAPWLRVGLATGAGLLVAVEGDTLLPGVWGGLVAATASLVVYAGAVAGLGLLPAPAVRLLRGRRP